MSGIYQIVRETFPSGRIRLVITAPSADEALEDDPPAGAEATTEINTAQANADAANERVREVIRRVYVSKDCPAGTGAVSGPVATRLRAEFSAQADAGKG